MTGDILFLTHRVPFPPDRGDKIRSWNILQALAKIAPVHVVALCDDAADLEHAEKIASVAASVHLIPHQKSRAMAVAEALLGGGSASVRACASPALTSCVHKLMQTHPIAAVYAFSGQMAQYMPESLGSTRFVMDFVDIDSQKFAAWGDERAGLSGLANRFEAKRLFAFERAVANRAAVSLFVSDAEAQLFRDKTGLDTQKVQTLENGIDLDRYHPAHEGRAEPAGQGPLIVFTGQMDYAPNEDAVDWFARFVVPHLPGIRFAIVGRAPSARVRTLGGIAGVTVTGEVADTRDWIASADVVVAPLLLARGVQNKVLEAMAMGKAVVASPAAAEGINAVAGEHLRVAESAEGQAAAINELLAAPEIAAKLGKAARAQMEARYGWAATLARLPLLLAGDGA